MHLPKNIAKSFILLGAFLASIDAWGSAPVLSVPKGSQSLPVAIDLPENFVAEKDTTPIPSLQRTTQILRYRHNCLLHKTTMGSPVTRKKCCLQSFHLGRRLFHSDLFGRLEERRRIRSSLMKRRTKRSPFWKTASLFTPSIME